LNGNLLTQVVFL